MFERFTIEGPDGVRTWRSERAIETVLIGRAPECDIVIEDPGVSRRHLKLDIDGEQLRFEDLSSAAGVFLVEADGGERRVTNGVLGFDQRLRIARWQLRHGGPSVAPRRKPAAPKLALEVAHPARPRQRFELLTYRSLAFDRTGQVTLNGRFGRGSHPELLFIQWWSHTQEPAFHSVGGRRGNERQSPLPPLVNGSPLATAALKAGDTLAWHELTIVVSEVKELRPPERGMVEAARQSDAALQVYADWLETQGDDASAEWARLALSGDEAARARMAVLAKGLGASARAALARGPVERCQKKGCGQRWESLSLEKEPWERTCAECTRTVSWCEDAETARSVVGPVVLDPATPRAAGDLLPRPVMVG